LSRKLSESPEYVERFIREARAAARLNHANIVRTFDAGSTGGLHYYAMELVEGESLRKSLEPGALPPESALSVALDIARALEHAERNRVTHRDVKPDNILIEAATGRAKLADLG